LTPPAITVTFAGNWYTSGFTMESMALNTEIEWEDVFVNGHFAALTTFPVKEGAMFLCKIAENDIVNFNLAFPSRTTLTETAAGDHVTQREKLGFGDKATSTQRALCWEGASPQGGSRLFYSPICVAIDPLELTMQNSHEGYNAGFRLLCDPAQAAGERIFQLIDIIAVATA